MGRRRSDVNRVIDEKIKERESYWGRPRGPEYLRSLLESSADRTFPRVSLVLEILKVSQDDLLEEFTNIFTTTTPRDLAQFYSKTRDKSADPDKARRIPNVLLAPTRHLTLQELHIAFRIRRDHVTIKDLGDLSSGLEKTVGKLCGLFIRHFRDLQDRQPELLNLTRRLCERGSNSFEYGFRSSGRITRGSVTFVIIPPFPNDFTNLTIASWLEQ